MKKYCVNISIYVDSGLQINFMLKFIFLNAYMHMIKLIIMLMLIQFQVYPLYTSCTQPDQHLIPHNCKTTTKKKC